MIRSPLSGQSEIPLIVIVTVSVAGTVLLLLNIVLISVFVAKKRRKEQQQGVIKRSTPASSTEGKIRWRRYKSPVEDY